MEVLWTSDAALTANELRDALAVRDPLGRTVATTTVLTVLSRLERKGFVRALARRATPPLPRAAQPRGAHRRARCTRCSTARPTATPRSPGS